MRDTIIVNLADFTDPNDKNGRTYRQVNESKHHKFCIGDLVEIVTGARVFVAKQTRDCDGTPLYSLTPIKGDYIQHTEGFGSPVWLNGYTEERLSLVKRLDSVEAQEKE